MGAATRSTRTGWTAGWSGRAAAAPMRRRVFRRSSKSARRFFPTGFAPTCRISRHGWTISNGKVPRRGRSGPPDDHRHARRDQIGGRTDDANAPLEPVYRAAFAAIDGDPDQLLTVAESTARSRHDAVELFSRPAQRGAWRGQIEAVRVSAERRNRGLGESDDRMGGRSMPRARLHHGAAHLE